MSKSGRTAWEHCYPTSTSTLEDYPTPRLPHHHHLLLHPASTTQEHRGSLGAFLTASAGTAQLGGWTQPSLQGSQPPVATVWTLFKTTIPHTGSSPCRRSQKWTPRPAPPHKMALSGASHPPTEPPGHTTRPQPAGSTPHHQASRQPSDPQHRPRQICYRAPVSTATRNCQHKYHHLEPHRISRYRVQNY